MAETATKRRASRARTKQPDTPAEQADQLPGYDPSQHGGGAAHGAPELRDVPMRCIDIEPGFNPRQHYDEDQLAALARSITMHGLVQPVLLRPTPKGEQKGDVLFYLTGGHRRFMAAKMAGVRTIPAIIRQGGDVLAAAVLDNSHRVDLTPLEEALVYARAQHDRGLTVKGVAERFSVRQKHVTERLRILGLPDVVQKAIGDGVLSSSAQQVNWYAEITEKSPLLAAAIGAADVAEGGRLSGHQLQDVIAGTKGVFSVNSIEAGTSAYKMRSPEIRTAVDALAEASRGNWNTVGRKWHEAHEHKDQVTAQKYFGSDRARLHLPKAMIEEGEKVGAIVTVALDHYRVQVVIDQRWLQASLDEAIPKAAKSLAAAVARGKASPAKTSKPDKELSTADLAERNRRRKELAAKREQQAAAREANTRLGPALLKHLGSVPLTLDTVKAVCLMLLPPRPSGGYYQDDHAHAGAIAGGGLRYVFPEWKVEVEQKKGTKIELECDLGKLDERFWQWWDLAKTPEEVLGRTIVAFAAIHYVDRREAMSKEVLYKARTTVPGHKDAAALIEKLFDTHAPGPLRKKGSGARGGVPLVEVLDDDDDLAEGEAAA